MAVLVILLMLLGPRAAVAQPSVSWLSPLLGVWATTDTYYPVSGAPIIEDATRTCRLVMHDAYVECETAVKRPNGTARTYRFLINLNRNTSRFEMLSVWSNVPHKAVQTMTPNAVHDRWIIEDLAVIGDDGGSNEHWSELVIENVDRIVWTGKRITGGVDPQTAAISFRESWTRLQPFGINGRVVGIGQHAALHALDRDALAGVRRVDAARRPRCGCSNARVGGERHRGRDDPAPSLISDPDVASPAAAGRRGDR